MKQLTWADVAHYYMRNNPKPTVWGPDNGEGDYEIVEWNDKFPVPFFNPSCAHYLEDMLPELIDIADITEEHAAHVLELVNAKPLFEGVWTAREILIDQFDEQHAKIQGSVIAAVLGSPEVLHYLIQANYNVFKVPTYKQQL